MEYFVNATVKFKGECNLKMVDKKIKERLTAKYCYTENSYAVSKNNDVVEIEHFDNFDFYSVEDLVKAAVSAGLKKFGRDKLIAFQTTAGCYFKNYVTKDGRFLDYCGDCIY